MISQRTKGRLLLVFVTAMWGSTFVAVKLAVGTVAPSIVTLARFLLAAIVFIPWLPRDIRLWRKGFELGFWLGAGYATQTIGLQYTSASQSAFITVLNVIFVPILALTVGQQVRRAVWLAAIIAIAGVGLLTGGIDRLGVGDAWTLLCALVYAVYIMRLGQTAGQYPALPLTAVQLWSVAAFATVWVGSTAAHPVHVPWLLLLYLGLATTALTTLLQTVGQQSIDASEAAVIYTLEPVWAAGFAAVFLTERLNAEGFLGAALIVAATLLSQMPTVSKKRRSSINTNIDG